LNYLPKNAATSKHVPESLAHTLIQLLQPSYTQASKKPLNTATSMKM